MTETEFTVFMICFFGGAFLLGLGIFLSSLREEYMDKTFPERLERFKLEAYRSGVKDASIRVKKD